MGCDIHIIAERRIALFANDEYRWRNAGTPTVFRDYNLFAMLADVRNAGLPVIANPRGIPGFKDWEKGWTEDHWPAGTLDKLEEVPCDEYLRMASDMGVDGHSHSWLTTEEINEFYEAQNCEKDWESTIACFDYGNFSPTMLLSASFTNGKRSAPTSFGRAKPWLHSLNELRDWLVKYEADRIVFFFDN